MAPLGVRVFSSPLAFVTGCLVWIPVCCWIISLVHWMIQGDVDVIWGIVGIFAALLLGFYTMLPPRPELGPFLFGGVLLSSLLFPVFRSALRRHAFDAVDIEGIEDAYEMMRLKPDNYAARFKFAKLLYKRGMRGSALIFAEQALANLPQAGFFEERQLVEAWKRSAAFGAPLETGLVCLECGAQNELGTFVCRNCGAEIVLDHVRGRWVGRNLARKLLSAWAAVMLALIGVPIAAVMLPRTMAAGVIILLLVAAVGILAFGFYTAGGASA